MSDINYEHRCAIMFCLRLGYSSTETYEKLCLAYGDNDFSRAQVCRWFKAFAEGRESITNEAPSGRPSSSRTPESVGRTSSRTPENVGRTSSRTPENVDRTSSRTPENVGRTHDPGEKTDHQTVTKILSNGFRMRQICAKTVQKNLSQEKCKVSKVSIPVKVLNNATYCKEEENYDISQSTDIKIKVEPTLTDDVYQDSVVSEEKAKDFLVDCSRIKEEANPDSGNEEEHLDSMIDISETTFIKQEDRCYIGVEIKMEENCTGVGVKIKMEESCTGVNIKREKSSTGVKIKREECYTGVKIKKKKIEPDLYSEDDVS
ncbi:unnamed protein product [Nezara viridula]|uniref:Mos1 transposase HTH domain-containing protein n=1 Tax=Nezara viridula TaxID=85310 RepID=A0A9P0HSF3_NEZVI|nr:unnamed protein product [Nezara viridula]